MNPTKKLLLATCLAFAVTAPSSIAATVQFEGSSFVVHEGNHFIIWLKIGAASLPLAEKFEVTITATGTATLDKDYGWLNGPGRRVIEEDYFAYVQGWTSDDGEREGDEFIELTLSDPSSGTQLGAVTKARVTIKNVAGSVNAWNFSNNGFLEGRTKVGFINRQGDLDAEFTVDYFTEDQTAQAGRDYVGLKGTLHFLPGEKSKPVFLTAIADGVPESDKSFIFCLTNATAGIGISTPKTFLSITDNEMPENLDLQFNPPFGGGSFALQQDGKIVTIPILPHPQSADIVRLNRDGSLDATFRAPFFQEKDGSQNKSLSIKSSTAGQFFVSGSFAQVNGEPRANIARFNQDGSLDREFIPPASFGADTNCTALLIQRDGRPILRLFSSVIPSNVSHLIRLTHTGAIDETFSPVTLDSYGVSAIDQNDGRILLGGELNLINGLPVGFLVQLQTNGVMDESFRPALDARVGTFCVQDGLGIVFSGGLEPVGEYAPLRRLRFDGSLDPTFASDVENSYYSFILVAEDNRLVVLRLVVGNGEGSIVQRLGSNGALEGTNQFRIEPPWRSLADAALHEGELLLSGNISAVNGVERLGFARLLLNHTPSTGLSVSAIMPTIGLYRFMIIPNEGDRSIVFNVRRLGSSFDHIWFEYKTHDGSARAGEDYIHTEGYGELGPLEVETFITVPLLQDELIEGSETFSLAFEQASGVVNVGRPSVVTILDDEPQLVFTIVERPNEHLLHFTKPFLYRTPEWTVEASHDLSDWTAVGQITSDGLTHSEPKISPFRFYRAVRW